MPAYTTKTKRAFSGSQRLPTTGAAALAGKYQPKPAPAVAAGNQSNSREEF